MPKKLKDLHEIDPHAGNMSHRVAPGPPALTVLRVASSAIVTKGSSQLRTLYPYAMFRIKPEASTIVLINPIE